MSNKESSTLKDLQSLIGLLNFACSGKVPGRAFLRRHIDFMWGLSEPNSKIQLSVESKADISTLLTFNGKSFFLPRKCVSLDHVTLHTDASSCHGFAATLGSSWFASPRDADLVKYRIAVKELFPIVLAIEMWGSSMRDKKVLFKSGNMVVIYIINKQTLKEKSIMRLIRRLVLATLSYNIHFRAKHIPGKHKPLITLSIPGCIPVLPTPRQGTYTHPTGSRKIWQKRFAVF